MRLTTSTLTAAAAFWASIPVEAAALEMVGQLPHGTFPACFSREDAEALRKVPVVDRHVLDVVDEAGCNVFGDSLTTVVENPAEAISAATLYIDGDPNGMHVHVLPFTMVEAATGRMVPTSTVGSERATACLSPSEARLFYDLELSSDFLGMSFFLQEGRCTMLDRGYSASIYELVDGTYAVSATDRRGVTADGFLDTRYLFPDMNRPTRREQ